VQRYRRRNDAEHRLQVMQRLRIPAAQLNIAIPRIRQFDLNADPPWAVFELLPGIPIPKAGDASLDGPRFPFFARLMGELLARWRQLPTAGLNLRDEWADSGHLVARAEAWIEDVPELNDMQRASLTSLIDELPRLFSNRPAVLPWRFYTGQFPHGRAVAYRTPRF
jgi:hypothetical protein